MTRYLVPPLRRLVQALSILVLIALPLASLYTHYNAARALDDLPESSWRTTAVQAIDKMVGESRVRAQAVETSQGTFWSARLFGFGLTDPLAGAEAIFSSRSFYVPLLISLIAPVALSVLLGRVFCGWICPMNTLLEVVDRCRRWLGLLEIRERDVRFSKGTKYLVLAVALGFVALMGVPFLALVYPPAVISREAHLLVFGTGLGMGAYLILAIMAFELLVSRRWWCRYICPGGGLYSLLGRFRLVRIRRDAGRCVECGDCIRACQFDLRPMLLTLTGMECTNCASCITACDSNALRFSLVLPVISGRENKHQRTQHKDKGATAGLPSSARGDVPNNDPLSTGKSRSDDSVKPGAQAPETENLNQTISPAGATENAATVDVAPPGLPDRISEPSPGVDTPGSTMSPVPGLNVTTKKTGDKSNATPTAKMLLLAIALSLLSQTAAQAHHILGLPHYSYKENYPQAPTLEYPATTGPYDVLMTSYPGVPVPGEAATVCFYIKDRNTQRPYERPVTVRVLQTSTFGANTVIHEPATHEPFDNQHKYTVTFPTDSEYIVELTMDVEGRTEVIPFLMVVGEPTATASVLVAVGAGLGIFLIVVRAVKKKRDRRRAGPSMRADNTRNVTAKQTEFAT